MEGKEYEWRWLPPCERTGRSKYGYVEKDKTLINLDLQAYAANRKTVDKNWHLIWPVALAFLAWAVIASHWDAISSFLNNAYAFGFVAVVAVGFLTIPLCLLFGYPRNGFGRLLKAFGVLASIFAVAPGITIASWFVLPKDWQHSLNLLASTGSVMAYVAIFGAYILLAGFLTTAIVRR